MRAGSGPPWPAHPLLTWLGPRPDYRAHKRVGAQFVLRNKPVLARHRPDAALERGMSFAPQPSTALRTGLPKGVGPSRQDERAPSSRAPFAHRANNRLYAAIETFTLSDIASQHPFRYSSLRLLHPPPMVWIWPGPASARAFSCSHPTDDEGASARRPLPLYRERSDTEQGRRSPTRVQVVVDKDTARSRRGSTTGCSRPRRARPLSNCRMIRGCA